MLSYAYCWGIWKYVSWTVHIEHHLINAPGRSWPNQENTRRGISQYTPCHPPEADGREKEGAFLLPHLRETDRRVARCRAAGPGSITVGFARVWYVPARLRRWRRRGGRRACAGATHAARRPSWASRPREGPGSVRFEQADPTSSARLHPLTTTPFDAVYCSQVIPHLAPWGQCPAGRGRDAPARALSRAGVAGLAPILTWAAAWVQSSRQERQWLAWRATAPAAAPATRNHQSWLDVEHHRGRDPGDAGGRPAVTPGWSRGRPRPWDGSKGPRAIWSRWLVLCTENSRNRFILLVLTVQSKTWNELPARALLLQA